MFSLSSSAVAFAALLSTNSAGSISENELRRTLDILCQPQWEGRLTLEPGAQKTAQWLIGELKGMGAKPGPDGKWLHNFQVTVNQRATTNNALSLRHEDGRSWRLNLGKDWVPLAGSKPMDLTLGELVFVGYGLNQEGWNDFAGVDLTGKIAVALRGTPEGRPASPTRAKALAAQQAGAVGLILVGPEREGYMELPPVSRRTGVPADSGMVGAAMTRAFFETALGLDWEKERKATAPNSRPLPFTARMVTETEPNVGRCDNVIAFIPGNDPKLKNEYIVVGAHYDHLGFGEVGSRTGNEIIHPGADDNASGVAGVLEIGEYFAQSKTNRRTIILQLYSGEEVGLVGAFAWVRDYPELVKNTTFMINMDMIGRLRENRLSLIGTSSYAGLEDLLRTTNVKNLTLSMVPTIAPNSDHAAFARAQVPHVFFHTGLTPEYHTENDTVDTLNFQGMVDVLEMVKATVYAVDKKDEKLPWNPNAVFPQPRQ